MVAALRRPWAIKVVSDKIDDVKVLDAAAEVDVGENGPRGWQGSGEDVAVLGQLNADSRQ